jgi:hypothetical protein
MLELRRAVHSSGIMTPIMMAIRTVLTVMAALTHEHDHWLVMDPKAERLVDTGSLEELGRKYCAIKDWERLGDR